MKVWEVVSLLWFRLLQIRVEGSRITQRSLPLNYSASKRRELHLPCIEEQGAFDIGFFLEIKSKSYSKFTTEDISLQPAFRL